MSSPFFRIPVRTLLLVIVLHLLESSNCEGIKRVPQGFVGMRGKKYYDYDDTGTTDKRRSQGFIGVKGKKDLLFSPYDPYSFYKRAPMGFVGMRGKKDEYEPFDYSRMSAEYVPKRGSILGQIDYYSGEDDLENDKFALLNELLQRYVVEHGGFSKDTNSLSTNEDQKNSDEGLEYSGISDLTKRAAQMNQFFGMRGKKSDNVSYRGNKRPFDLSFRGKFVGVRGKKSTDVEPMAQGGDLMKRKGPGSGFFGMRGKKWVNPDFSSNETPVN